MAPSFEMASQMPEPYGALPVLKVLRRNARFLQETGKSKEDALEPIQPVEKPAGLVEPPGLVESVRARELGQAEQSLVAGNRPEMETYELLQNVIRDDVNVHRVVLAWRAHDLLRFTGAQQSVTLLRQSIRFCIDEDSRRVHQGHPANEIGTLLPKLMEEHRLEGRERGTRAADEAWIERMADTIFSADRATAAGAAAAALSEGFDPEEIGKAMSLAATRLLLHDPGLKQEVPGRPLGSVHGASVGVHASDAANAWRHVARVGGTRNAFASLIAGAYHTAGQSSLVGKQPIDHEGEPCKLEAPGDLLREIEARIRARDQIGACLAARRHGEAGHLPEPLFALLLGFAVSEEGALHAEKYFRTAQEEHSLAPARHRPLYLVALTRVAASQFGAPAPGYEQARKLLAG
jgi:hypothetical protein